VPTADFEIGSIHFPEKSVCLPVTVREPMKTSRLFSFAVGTACFFTLTSSALYAGANFLLKLDGINHSNWIDVESFSAGDKTFQITKRMDNTSAQLSQSSVSGRPIAEAVIFIKRENLTYKFSDVFITSIQMVPAGTTPMERCTFAFRKRG
jgi:hypothetical protein